MSAKTSFGVWLRQRRKVLDLPLDKLAESVGCAAITLYKIETGERRPSRQIAELLAQNLNIPSKDHSTFMRFARGEEVPPHWYAPSTNLTNPPTPLIGREQDIITVRKRLLRDDTQLLTLIGPPGIGKSRLSLAVAHTLLSEFSDGVFLVLLASISDLKLVSRTITQTLGLLEIGPQPALERLKTYLRDKQTLLVLDNFEQILAAASQVAELLAVCPFVKILATSRAPLRIRREHQFPVPALALPDVQHLPGVETLSNYAAVELFIERAQAVKPDFSLTPENGQPVAAICNRLDGLPLAIELISARVKLLPPATLLEWLHGRLLLQSDGLRDLDPRHRTLNAAIGWSYELLDEREKTLFRWLGVFLGGWTIEAAQAICQPENSIVDGLAALLDKCLIQQKADPQPRFSMLETICEYALERLEESGEIQDIRQRHARYFLKLAETPAIEQSVWLDQIEQNIDNVRAALSWCFTSDLLTGLRLTLAVSGYWLIRGHLIEGRKWLEKSLEACHHEVVASQRIERELLDSAAKMSHFQGDMLAMCEYGERLLAHGEEHEDRASTAFACLYLGIDALHRQDFGRAGIIVETGLALACELDLNDLAGALLLMLGVLAFSQKDYERAVPLFAKGLEIQHKLGNRFVEQMLLHRLGQALEGYGRYRQARELYIQGMNICRVLGSKLELALSLEFLGRLASVDKGDHQRAVRLLGAAEVMRESIFAPIPPLLQSLHDDLVAHLRANLDESSFTTAWTAGRLFTLEQAIEYALFE